MLPFIVKLPEEIIKEIEIWKIECDKIKNSPLGYLKKHENAGAETNNFQTSVPKNLIESSYWLPFTLRNCAKLFGGTHRNYFLKEWNGHFDGYDVWINYSYKGNYNPVHNHSGKISGVIYLTNEDNTIFPKLNFKYKGERGDMILFFAHIFHGVDKQAKDYHRITFAFNINVTNLIHNRT